MSEAWRSHERLAVAVRAALFAVPVLAAVGAAGVAAQVTPGPYAVRLVVTLVVAGVVLAALERAGRRFLPLPTLLRLALVFPDQAPDRLKVALRAGSTRDLMTAARQPRPSGAQAAALHTVELLGALARHDAGTRRHSERVRAYTDLLAEALDVPEAERSRLRWASLLHDLGKLRLDPAVLGKPSALDDHEWHQVRAHPAAGAELAGDLQDFLGPWFDSIEQHHERWDGAGYPHGLQGSQICMGARIVAVADSFDVMTAGRSYRRAMDPASARQELVRCGGTQFDPEVVRGLLTLSLGRMGRLGQSLALVVAAPLAGLPDLGLHPAAAVHGSAKAHLVTSVSGHGAGFEHHASAAHDGGAGAAAHQHGE